MTRFNFTVLLAILTCTLSHFVHAQELPIPIADVQRDSQIDFSKEIMPILKRNCLACHHERESEGGLILETIESIHLGGDGGSTVDLESPLSSLLLTRTTGEEEPLMPPEDNAVGAKPLTPLELGLIKRWIEQGAKGSEMLTESIQWQEIPESIRTSFAVEMAPTKQFAVVGRGNRTHVIHMPETVGNLTSNSISHLHDPSVPGENATHVDLVQSVAVSPDAKRIATGGFRTVKLWKQVPNPLSAPTVNLMNAAGPIRINQDQTHAACVNPLGDLEVWNLEENSLKAVLKGHSNPIASIHWITSEAMVSADTSGKIVQWNIGTGEIKQELQSGISIRSLSCSSDGTQLAVVSIQGMIYRGQIATESGSISIQAEPIPDIAGATHTIFYDKDSPNLIVSDSSQNVTILGEKNNIIRKIDHGSPVTAIDISNTSLQLLTGGSNGTIKSWNLENGEAIHTFQSDADQQLLLTYAERATTRQNLKVDRLNKQTEELDKRLKSENEVLAKATEEKTKAQATVEEKEKARGDAAKLVATTEADIKQAQDAITMAEKKTEESQKTLTDTDLKTKAITQELEKETLQLSDANETVQKLKAELDAMSEQLKQAESQAAKIQQQVEEKKNVLEKTKQLSMTAKMNIATAAKTITDSRAAIENGNKELEGLKKDLTKTEEEKIKSEADLAKRQQAFDTAKEAQKRAESAIPRHKEIIESEDREKQRLTQELETVKNSLAGNSQRVVSISINDARQWLATTHVDQSLRIYDLKTGTPLMRFSAAIDPAKITSIGMCWLNSEVLVFGNQQATQAWSTGYGWALEKTIGSPDDPSVLSDRITAMDFRLDGLSIAVGSGSPSRSGEVKVFSVETGQLIRDFGEIHSDSVLGLKFSPRGNLIASSAADKTVRLLDLSSGEVRRSLEGHTHHVLAVAWQDDEQTLASASADKTIKIWDIETGEQRRTISGFGKEITALSYVAATNQLVTACADGQARLYDTSNGKSLRSFNANGDFLYSLSTSLDGKQLLSSGQSGTLRLWNIEDGKLINEWE